MPATKGKIIGIDLGATNIRAAVVHGGVQQPVVSRRINTRGTEEQVLADIYWVIEQLMGDDIQAIGIGVPGIVDVKQGIVYDIQHIPSWIEVPLKTILRERYQLPVFINNDANCFALGEYYFGESYSADNVVALTIGTGLGAGVIINRQLYAGPNCGAGEFGMVDYLDRNIEYYASGSFFNNVYGLNGEDVFNAALSGDAGALGLYKELGTHLGNAVKLVLYTFDPELIILGGSVNAAYAYFEASMWQRIHTFAYRKPVERLVIRCGNIRHAAIAGAAALVFDAGQ